MIMVLYSEINTIFRFLTDFLCVLLYRTVVQAHANVLYGHHKYIAKAMYL